jgi:soluble cytochrome b562
VLARLKELNGAFSLILNVIAVGAVIIGAYNIKIVADRALEETAKNAKAIEKNRTEIDARKSETAQVLVDVSELKGELKAFNKNADRLYKQLEDAKRLYYQANSK